MKLVKKLTRFYKEETKGLPHDEAELFDLAYDLADVLDQEGEDSNAWKGGGRYGTRFYHNLDDFIADLRSKHDVVMIDCAVNTMHQGLLDALNDNSEAMMVLCEGNIVEYLLHREDEEFEERLEQAFEEMGAD